MRQAVLKPRPNGRSRRDVVGEVKPPIGAREDLFRVTRVRDDRIYWDVGKVPGLVRPGEGPTAGVAINAIDVSGRCRCVRIETPDRGIGTRCASGGRIERYIENRTVR